MVPLAMMKPREALKPTLMPERTASMWVPGGRRWETAMLTASLGVPSTTQVGQPKPRSHLAACTGRPRDLAAPIQLCSVLGATTESW